MSDPDNRVVDYLDLGETTSIWQSLWRLSRTIRGRIVLITFLAFVGSFAEAFMLLALATTATAIAAGQSSIEQSWLAFHIEVEIPVVLALVAGVLVVRLVAQLASTYVSVRLSATRARTIRQALIADFAEADWATKSTERMGHLQEAVSSFVTSCNQVILTGTKAVTFAMSLVVLVVSALVVSPVSALAIAGTTAVISAALRPLALKARRHSREARDAGLDLMAAVNELSSTALESQAFGVSEQMVERADHHITAVERHRTRAAFWSNITPSLHQGLSLLTVIGAIAIIYAFAPGRLGELGAIVLLFVRALTYAQGLQTSYAQINTALPSIEELGETIRRYEAARVVDGNQSFDRLERLEFSNVSYRYPGRDVGVHDLSFAIEAGESIGVIGPTGSGKSTLLQLVLRLRDPSTGAVLVNGIDLRSIRLADWYRQIGFVSQSSTLLDASIRDNVRFLRDDLTDEAIDRAIEGAHLTDDIAGFPDGEHTIVGPGGGHVSGGQRQRIALARSLAGGPSLLILDEPTSSLDLPTEAFVQQTIDDLKGKITMIIVAHRLSTVRSCDRIMVLDHGGLKAFAHPTELAESSEYFRTAIDLSQVPGPT